MCKASFNACIFFLIKTSQLLLMLSIDTPLGSIAANRIEGGCHKQQQNINYALEILNFPRFSERQILVGDAGGLVLQKFTYTCMEITSL